MGKGRKPLPTAMHEANGSYKINPSRKNKEEPVAPAGRPDIPESVACNEVAFGAWNRISAILEQMRVLTQADQFVLEQYANDYAQWYSLNKMVANGACSTVSKYGAQLMPEASQLHAYANRMLKILTELGLTPSSRTKLKAAAPMEDDPFMEWMKGVGRG